MRAINAKLLRDLKRLWPQLLAIALVMACGVGGLTMAITASRTLERSLDTYYEQARFADVFAHLTRAPLALTADLREVPGVAVIEPRIVTDATLDVEGVAEPVIGRIIALSQHNQPRLNRLHLRAGRFPEPAASPPEALVSVAFAEANDLEPGDAIDAVIRGTLTRLRIVGAALSPEFVYALRAGGFVPDDKRFAVVWMPEEQLAALTDLDGAFNDILATLTPGANPNAVIDGIDALTEPYGGAGAYTRDEQASHRYVRDEFAQLRAMATVTPTVFLIVSALLVNIVLARLVRTQREQIAVLKAFGYSSRQVALHYLAFAAAVSATGATLGILLGAWLGHTLTTLYARFFRFPHFEYRLEIGAVLIAVALTTAFAVFGALRSVRSAAALPPAEAMRPESPPDYRVSFSERLRLTRFLSPGANMILRHLERRPLRALISSLGVALSIAVLTLGTYVQDALDFLVDFQFHASQRYDLAVAFNEARPPSAAYELASIDGVTQVEPFRAVATRIHHAHRSRRESLVGLPAEQALARTLDEHARPLALPPTGLTLTETLADLLHARPGDRLTIEVLEGDRQRFNAPVERISATYVGTGAYIDAGALRRHLREGELASGAYITIDRSRAAAIYNRLKHTPGVATVVVRRATIDSFEKTLAENILIMRSFNLAFACVIAVGVVFNSSRIALAERAHELATLRVLGMHRAEVGAIFLGELAALALIAVPLGLALGYALCAFATTMLATETQRIPFVIDAGTMGFAVAVVLAAACATAIEARRQIDQLDLLAVLKAAA